MDEQLPSMPEEEAIQEGRSSSIIDLSGATISPEQSGADGDRHVERNQSGGGDAGSAGVDGAAQDGRPGKVEFQRQQSDAPSIMLPNQQVRMSEMLSARQN